MTRRPWSGIGASLAGARTIDANKCVPILGDGLLGEPCQGSDPVDATDDCSGERARWLLSEGCATADEVVPQPLRGS